MKKSSDRINFEKSCDAFYKKTNLLKFIVIFFFPLYLILLLLYAAIYMHNILQQPKEQFVFYFLFQIVLAVFLGIARKKAFTLTKGAWYYILISFGGMCINGIITEGIQTLCLAIVLFVFFYYYMCNRISLFNQQSTDE